MYAFFNKPIGPDYMSHFPLPLVTCLEAGKFRVSGESEMRASTTDLSDSYAYCTLMVAYTSTPRPSELFGLSASVYAKGGFREIQMTCLSELTDWLESKTHVNALKAVRPPELVYRVHFARGVSSDSFYQESAPVVDYCILDSDQPDVDNDLTWNKTSLSHRGKGGSVNKGVLQPRTPFPLRRRPGLLDAIQRIPGNPSGAPYVTHPDQVGSVMEPLRVAFRVHQPLAAKAQCITSMHVSVAGSINALVGETPTYAFTEFRPHSERHQRPPSRASSAASSSDSAKAKGASSPGFLEKMTGPRTVAVDPEGKAPEGSL